MAITARSVSSRVDAEGVQVGLLGFGAVGLGDGGDAGLVQQPLEGDLGRGDAVLAGDGLQLLVLRQAALGQGGIGGDG